MDSRRRSTNEDALAMINICHGLAGPPISCSNDVDVIASCEYKPVSTAISSVTRSSMRADHHRSAVIEQRHQFDRFLLGFLHYRPHDL